MDTRTSLTTLICRTSSFYIPLPTYLNVNQRGTEFQLLPVKVMYRATAGRELFFSACFKSYRQVSTAVPGFAENLMGFLAVDPQPCPLSFGLFCQHWVYFMFLVLYCSDTDSIAQRESVQQNNASNVQTFSQYYSIRQPTCFIQKYLKSI